MYQQGDSKHSPITYGVILGSVIVVLLVFFRSSKEASPTSLREQFAPGPTAIGGGGSVIEMPEGVRSLAETAQARLLGGEEVAPMTPVASSGALEVTISTLAKVDGGMRVTGNVRNVGRQPLTVPLSAFRFRDQSGVIYAAQGDAKALLEPGQSTTLDLTLPISEPVDLVMLVELPADGVQLELVLLAAGATPTPGR